VICFATDQTIGSQGKYIGLGTQSGEHDVVSVIHPFGQETFVVGMTVKVAQGNSPTTGHARLYHDSDLTDLGELIPEDDPYPPIPGCDPGDGNDGIDNDGFGPNPNRSTCMAMFDVCDGDQPTNGANRLGVKDSLSVFVKTDTGNFEGASACVVLESLAAVEAACLANPSPTSATDSSGSEPDPEPKPKGKKNS